MTEEEQKAKDKAEKEERDAQRQYSLERLKLQVQLGVAIIGLLGTLITALVALYTAAKKVNESTGQPTNFVSVVQTLTTLANPSKPASSSFPDHPSQQAVATVSPSTRPVSKAPEQVTIPTDVGTSQEILQRCSGFEPLTPIRVHVDRGLDSYMVSLDLKNPSDQTIAVFTKSGGAPFTLTTGGEVLQAPSNIRDEGKFTFFHGFDAQQWDNSFASGLQVPSQGTVHITGQFRGKKQPPSGTSAEFSLTLLYLLKDGNGAKAMNVRSSQCSAIPVTENQ